jgi:N-acetylglucosamine kinase-like BadF-type ATPase
MHLIVDSGSTKSDWVIVDRENRHEYYTIGLNPFFHDEDSVYDAVSANKELFLFRDKISHLYFYGAGCSSENLNAIIENGLQRVFKNAKIVVDHDLKASAYATYEGEPSISCIIGTGSNSCFYDGVNVIERVPALGYILGDEGSGSYFGKQLLTDFLYHKLPQNIHNSLVEELGLTKAEIIKNVYMRPNANVYLASFMKFIFNHANDNYFKEMIYEGFKHFTSIHVCCYPNYRNYKTHFIGSIAFLFETELKKACEFHGIKIGQVVRKPISGLIDYHERVGVA